MQKINLKNKPALSESEVGEHEYLVRTRGYSIVHGFLSEDEINVLKNGMEKAIEDYRPVDGVERSFLDRYQIHDLIVRDINYARLLEDPRLQQLVAPHLGEHWIMYAATSSSIPPGGSNYASRLHVDSPRFVPGYTFNIGMIWTLDDYTLDSGGALKILPGSHHLQEEPSFDLFEKYCIHAECQAGSLLIFNAKIYHRTYDNVTDKWNHSMTLNACRSYMKQRLDWVRFMPKEVVQELNAQAKRLLGYDTRLPTNLEEFFLPDSERLYKPNQG